MSFTHSVNVTLYAEYTIPNIERILLRGQNQLGFIYEDNILDQEIHDPQKIDPREAAQKIMQAYELNLDLGSRVKTILKEDPRTKQTNLWFNESVQLWFNTGDAGYLRVSMGAFNNEKENDYGIDFDHYIRLCLDLCLDFPIIELSTSTI